jgi:hypothetical protein
MGQKGQNMRYNNGNYVSKRTIITGVLVLIALAALVIGICLLVNQYHPFINVEDTSKAVSTAVSSVASSSVAA